MISQRTLPQSNPSLSMLLALSVASVTSSAWAVESNGWKKHIVLPATQRAAVNSAVAADFDSDTNVDVIASYDGKVVVHQGPDWKPHIVHTFGSTDSRNKPRPACIHSCLMDVDRDGDMDFIGSNMTTFWLECPSDPFRDEPWTYRTIDDEILGTHCVLTGDVNKDGRLDLIANSYQSDSAKTPITNSILWLEVPRDPKSAKHWHRHIFADGDAPGGNHYMGMGDLNSDGRDDIACGAKGGENFPGGQWFAWWEQPANPKATWKKHLLAENEVGATNIHPTDLNGDGINDLFATRGHGKGVVWFKGPNFKKIEIDPEIARPHCLVTTDLDGDGDIDAATCGSEIDGIAVWYKNDGKGNFSRHVIGENQSSYDIRAVDMDGDDDLDLLIAGHHSKNIVWYENASN